MPSERIGGDADGMSEATDDDLVKRAVVIDLDEIPHVRPRHVDVAADLRQANGIGVPIIVTDGGVRRILTVLVVGEETDIAGKVRDQDPSSGGKGDPVWTTELAVVHDRESR